MSAKSLHLYVVHSQFKKELLQEIKNPELDFGNFVISQNKIKDSVWAQDIWYNIKEIHFESISQAAKELKSIHSHWVIESLNHHRRAQLIQDKLNYYKYPRLDFLDEFPKQKFGCALMVDEKTIWASADCRSPIPFGRIEFNEDKNIPPSRAYLKLWEALTIHGAVPSAKETCLDLGSCPGGWSWVLSKVAKKVISVDKAPLDPKIAKIKNIHFLKKDAFKLRPEEVEHVDWIFSDIICEPARLLELIEVWRKANIKNFVCTIKFKGQTDFGIIDRFREIKGSHVFHLYHNKHEVTWILFDQIKS